VSSLDDVVSELQKRGDRQSAELKKHTNELEKQAEVLVELLEVTAEIRTSQLALTSAITQFVTQ
jgi:predicted  nucleic acid-binding Zn-ribbon protein